MATDIEIITEIANKIINSYYTSGSMAIELPENWNRKFVDLHLTFSDGRLVFINAY